MDLKGLYKILKETTFEFRKGAEVEVDQSGPAEAISIYMMPHERVAPAELEMVDVFFMTIGVDKAKAEARRADLIKILDHWPEPEILAGGPSYITVGGTIGDQSAAFQLFALGKVLCLWEIITPTGLGLTGRDAENAAGNGFIMITGYTPS